MKSAVFASAVAVASAETVNLTFKDCGSSSTHAKINSLSPDSIQVPGKETVTGTGSLDNDQTSASFNLKVKKGILPFVSGKGSICEDNTINLPLGAGSFTVKGLDCPIKAGAVSVAVDLDLASSLFEDGENSLLTIHIDANADDTGDQVICMDIDASLGMRSASAWEEFKAKYGKVYNGPDHEAEHRQVYEANMQWAAENSNAETSFGENLFADLTQEQYKVAAGLGYKPSALKSLPHLGVHEYNGEELAATVDWSTKGAVTPVKDQGQCGSCWAFSTTGGMEGAWQIASGSLTSMSEQQLVDCSTQNAGCNGGSMELAFNYAGTTNVATESSYPYTARDGSCKSSFTTAIPRGGVTGYKSVGTSTTALKSALNTGPVSVAIEADQMAFQMYSGGVLSSGCGTNLDHGVLAVGYDSNSFKVKNSWGASWGQNGYLQISQSGNTCGIHSDASYPTVSAALRSGDDEAKYEEWKAAFGSNGGEGEFEVFQSNLRVIEQLQVDDPTASYSHMTPFANVSPEDFKTRNGYRQTTGATPAPLLDVSNVAASYDWRDHGAVNPIKDQGQCGSCWAFSTVANVEGAGQVETGKLLNLSEQQLVDCDSSDSGCNGGLPSNAFQYMIDQGMGLEAESAYPYTAADGTCTKSQSQEKAFITAWQQISTDETQIAASLQQYGPLSIGINANTFQFYSGGVANPSSFLCNPSALDHGVAIVGFGTDGGQDYWTIRNSWGTSWGEAGYIRMVRGKGACGLNTDVMTATGISTATSVQV